MLGLVIFLCEPPGFNDFLCMPCEIPYASSSPASTAGKSDGFFRLIGHAPGGADRTTSGDKFPLPPGVLETSDDG